MKLFITSTNYPFLPQNVTPPEPSLSLAPEFSRRIACCLVMTEICFENVSSKLESF
jgi:hypothetical protein